MRFIRTVQSLALINMRRAIFITIFFAELLVPQAMHAQGTLFLSNLGQSSVAHEAVGSDSWLAQGFSTGSNPGGYALNSIQLFMDAASGNPSGFTISIYSSLNPAESLGNLTGSNPLVAGTFNYNASNITLSPSTGYYIVVSSQTPVRTGAYNWSAANDSSPSNNGWFIAVYDYSTDGLNWNYSRNHFFQFGIYATPVPEPSAWSLILLGGGVLIYVRTRQHRSA